MQGKEIPSIRKNGAMTKHKIHLGLASDDNLARGNIWTLTAKNTDFYIDFHGTHNAGMHLSIHGPNKEFKTHRFHVKANRKLVKEAREEGNFVEHALGKGYAFNGLKLAPNAYLVARIRWRWDLQREKFKKSSLSRTGFPTLNAPDEGIYMKSKLYPNSAWDVDIVVSFEKPYWPDEHRSIKDHARLSPLTNNSGMWLTATSYQRPMAQYLTPGDLNLPVPLNSSEPHIFLGAGPGINGVDDLYWFVEGITRQDLLLGTADYRIG